MGLCEGFQVHYSWVLGTALVSEKVKVVSVMLLEVVTVTERLQEVMSVSENVVKSSVPVSKRL